LNGGRQIFDLYTCPQSNRCGIKANTVRNPILISGGQAYSLSVIATSILLLQTSGMLQILSGSGLLIVRDDLFVFLVSSGLGTEILFWISVARLHMFSIRGPVL
jgi:hypothetical protein